MSYSSIAKLFGCNHATVIHGEKVINQFLEVRDNDTLSAMSVWIDIIQEVMPNNINDMFTTKDRLLSVLESTLLSNESKVGLLEELLKKYKDNALV